MNKKILCKINLHDYLYLGNEKVITYHPVFNPVVSRKYICKFCEKIKIKNFERPSI